MIDSATEEYSISVPREDFQLLWQYASGQYPAVLSPAYRSCRICVRTESIAPHTSEFILILPSTVQLSVKTNEPVPVQPCLNVSVVYALDHII